MTLNPKIQRALELFDEFFPSNGLTAEQIVYLEKCRATWRIFVADYLKNQEQIRGQAEKFLKNTSNHLKEIMIQSNGKKTRKLPTLLCDTK